jgi:hypothetical protein
MSTQHEASAADTAITRDGAGAGEPTTHPYGGQMPYQPLPPHGYGQWEMRPRRVYPIETKPFFLTSEFVGAVLAIAGIAITAAASDSFGAWRAWILITAVVVGYMVSRGIAKSGTRSHADDPRESLDLNFGRRGGDSR